MTFWYKTLAFLVLIAVTSVTPKDTYLGYFLAGFWGVIGTAVAFLVLVSLMIGEDKK